MSVSEALAIARAAGCLASAMSRPKTQIKDHGTKMPVPAIDPVRYAWEKFHKVPFPRELSGSQ